jgi:hypothetical protein
MYVMNLKIEFCKVKLTKNGKNISREGGYIWGNVRKYRFEGAMWVCLCGEVRWVWKWSGNSLSVVAFFTL